MDRSALASDELLARRRLAYERAGVAGRVIGIIALVFLARNCAGDAACASFVLPPRAVYLGIIAAMVVTIAIAVRSMRFTRAGRFQRYAAVTAVELAAVWAMVVFAQPLTGHPGDPVNALVATGVLGNVGVLLGMRALEFNGQLGELVTARHALQRMAVHDPLTGLGNLLAEADHAMYRVKTAAR